MGVTELIFKLHSLKMQISAILKRHCCHRNSDDVTFLTNFEMFIVAVYMTYKFLFRECTIPSKIKSNLSVFNIFTKCMEATLIALRISCAE